MKRDPIFEKPTLCANRGAGASITYFIVDEFDNIRFVLVKLQLELIIVICSVIFAGVIFESRRSIRFNTIDLIVDTLRSVSIDH